MLVIVSALVVIALAAWVLTPILLTNYPTAFAAIPLLRDVIADGVTSEPPSGRGSRESRDLVIERPPEQREPTNVIAEPVPPPTEQQTQPPPALAAAPAAPTPPENESVSAVVPAPVGLAPWPPAEPQTTAPIDVDVVEESNMPPADFGPVPLPPRRPDASSLARLGIPLPRPRPAMAPSAEPESISDAERQLFDRLSAPN